MFFMPGKVNLQDWNQQVMQLGLGDTSTYSTDERRLKNENGQYNLYMYDGTEEVFINNICKDFKHPGVETRKFAVGSAGTNYFFKEAFTANPIPIGTPMEGPKFVQITNVTTTSMKVYCYNSSGALVSGWVYITVIGERYA